MDFTKLEEGIIEGETHKLTRHNKQLRRSIYIHIANTNSLPQLFSSTVTRFKEYINENVLRPDYNRDILYSFFEENKYGTTMKKVDRIELKVKELSHPLFPIINIAQSLKRSHQVTTKLNEIGYQHLYIVCMVDSSESSNTNTSDSDSGAWDAAPLKKKLKTCQKAIEVDCDTMLKYHDKNVTRITGTTVHVDVLIFIDKSVCKQLSEYLGLIYVEDLLIEAEESDMNSVLDRLNDKNAKLYKLIQSYINKRLIGGYNNICLVHTFELWENFSANVRGVISNGNDYLFYIGPTKTANFCVELGKEFSLIDYVEAVGIIINRALSCETHVIGKYQCGEKSFCDVKLPLISIIPLYVLRYFTQRKITEQNHELI